ncbi:MAG: class B sortase [Clostridiales bacterium]|jgi:sortase B|nr:class B sortase [Clostridiales bacterium]
MGVTTNTAGRAAVKIVDSIVDFAVLTVILLSVAVAAYTIWDSNQIYQAADAARFTVYKPNPEDDSISFSDLQAINLEVFAWLTVYGTNIDYPVTQGDDNEKYVTTDAFGKYSLSGAIFLDYMNRMDFQDFNSILYGHHMEKQAMFGEIGSFGAKDFFERHAYGNLYHSGKDHGLEIFAFVKVDAYDNGVFMPCIEGVEDQRAYLDNLLEQALRTRDIGVTTEDRIILLSTCSSESTNGRDILLARITDELYSDPFKVEENDDTIQRVSISQQPGVWERIPMWLWIALSIFLLLLIVIVLINKKDRSKERWR